VKTINSNLLANILTSRASHNNNFLVLNENLKTSFKNIKEEMEDHLQSINENTEEIHSQSTRIFELDYKIEKLNEKLDEIRMLIEKSAGRDLEKIRKVFDLIPLTRAEQEVFMLMYASDTPLTFEEMSRRTGLMRPVAESYVESIIRKGIPVVKQFIGGREFVSVDKAFKDIQAKENVLEIQENVARTITSYM